MQRQRINRIHGGVNNQRLGVRMEYIQQEHRTLVEKLGWVVVAHARGFTTKLDEYAVDLDRLIEDIRLASSQYVEPDRIVDLSLMELEAFALRDFVRTCKR